MWDREVEFLTASEVPRHLSQRTGPCWACRASDDHPAFELIETQVSRGATRGRHRRRQNLGMDEAAGLISYEEVSRAAEAAKTEWLQTVGAPCAGRPGVIPTAYLKEALIGDWNVVVRI